MKNMIMILIGMIAFNGFAINKIVIPKRAVPGSTITASNTNENLDTIANKVNKLIDSLDIKFPRFTDYSSGDSTLISKRADFDTATSDTVNVTGGLKTTRATITSAGIGAETVTQSTIDSLRNRMGYFDSIYVAQKMRAESLYVAGGARFTRAYSPVADIDSLVGDTKAGGSIGSYYGVGYLRLDYSQGSLPGYPSNYFGVIKSSKDAIYFSVKNSYRQYFSGYLWSGVGSTIFSLLDTAGAMENVRLSTNGGSFINGSLKVQACTSSTFVGTLTGNVTGNISGSSESCTGNSATATYATTAGSATNGVVTSGSYNNPLWIQSLAGSKISGNILGGADSLSKNTWYFDTAFVCTLTNFTNPNLFTDSIGYIKWIKLGSMINIIIGGMNVQHDADNYVLVKSRTFDEYFSIKRSDLGYEASVAYRFGGSIPEKTCVLRMQGSCCSYPAIGYFCYETTTSFGGEDHCLVFSHN